MSSSDVIGPILYSRGADADGHRIAALLLLRDAVEPPELVPDEGAALAPSVADRLCGWTAWRYDFHLGSEGAGYHLGATFYPVAADLSNDVRLGYVSCNGMEHGDFDRPSDERNAMWARLLADHRSAPFGLLMHGGDQVYADCVVEADPLLAGWRDLPPSEAAIVDASPDMEEAATYRMFALWQRVMTARGTAEVLAEVPSVMMWDDHDIFDGWGSRPPAFQTSPVGRMIFRVARRFFRLFQAGGLEPTDGASFAERWNFDGFSVVAPDLRSERRTDRVMGLEGWSALEAFVAAIRPGQHLFVLSSVPALGPRLSVVERLHRVIPGFQKYEDDLRDQWQSYAHRAEWRRFLDLFATHMEAGGPVTFLSGEIHLAGRGEMRLKDKRLLHQLIASGIAHPPPPRAFASALGWLARLGEHPLPGRPIRFRPLPGQTGLYQAERNYLVLSRADGTWSASWHLEDSGVTPALAL